MVKTSVTRLRFVPAKRVSDCGSFHYFYRENALNCMPRLNFNVFPSLRYALPTSCGTRSHCVQEADLPRSRLFLLPFLRGSVRALFSLSSTLSLEGLSGTFSVTLHISLVTMAGNTSVNLPEFSSFLFISSVVR